MYTFAGQAASHAGTLLSVGVLSLALSLAGCGREEPALETSLKTYYLEVDGMVQSLGIT